MAENGEAKHEALEKILAQFRPTDEFDVYAMAPVNDE